jgi:hypothetical protein
LSRIRGVQPIFSTHHARLPNAFSYSIYTASDKEQNPYMHAGAETGIEDMAGSKDGTHII